MINKLLSDYTEFNKNYDMCKLRLGKQVLYRNCKNEEKNNQNIVGAHYNLFGYYDRLIIEQCDWYTLRPGQSDMSDDGMRDEYTVRLIRKKPSIVDYSKDEYSIVACCMVHLSNAYLKALVDKKTCGKAVHEAICDSILKDSATGDVLSEVWLDIGYSDIAVLMYSNGINGIKECVSKIKQMSFDGKLVTSATYTFVGYNPEKIEIINAHEEIGADIDIILNSDSDLKVQRGYIDSKIDITHTTELLHGSYDWCCHIEKMYFKELVKRHNERFGFEGKHNIITHVLLCEELDYNKKYKPNKVQDRKALDSRVNNAFNQFKDLYKDHLEKKHYAHHRALSSADEVVSLYYKVIDTNHSRDVKKIIGNFLVGFFNASSAIVLYMEKCKIVLSGDEKIVYDAANTEFKYNKYYLMIEDSIRDLKEYAGSLLFDILRSDSFYFEGQSSEHPTVGSAIKLLFTYNNILRKWDKAHKKCSNNDNEDTDFAYLVTSGGRDVTLNKDLFDGNHKVLLNYRVRNDGIVEEAASDNLSTTDKISRPMVVIVPEASLYDFNGSLLRMSHEFFHKRGDRLRKKRATTYYNSISKIAAEMFGYAIRAKTVKWEARCIFNKQIYRDIDERYGRYGYIDNYSQMFETWLRECVKGQYKNEDNKKYNDIFKELLNLDNNIYKLSQTALNELVRNVYEELVNSDNLKKSNRDLGDYSSHARVYNETCKMLGAVCGNKSVREKISGYLQKYFEECCCLNLPNEFILNKMKSHKHNLEYCKMLWDSFVQGIFINQGAEFEKTYNFTLVNMPSHLKSFYWQCCAFQIAYCESYADIMALTSLGFGKKENANEQIYKFLQYVFGFLFEQRNYKFVFNENNKPPFINENDDGDNIEFGGLFSRLIVVLKRFWGGITPSEFEKNESFIKDNIKKYYQQVICCKDSRTIEKHADELYVILLAAVTFYDKNIKDTDYLSSIDEYLDDCQKSNTRIIGLVGKESPIKNDFPKLIFDNWLDLIGGNNA